jgi:hypothetical protein
MAKKPRARRRSPAPTAEYRDAEGNILRLRETLSPGSVRAIKRAPVGAAASADDAWRRRAEMLFERLAVSWEIAGLPLEDQKLLLGRYRMADSDTQRWVQRTIASHVERFFPELGN